MSEIFRGGGVWKFSISFYVRGGGQIMSTLIPAPLHIKYEKNKVYAAYMSNQGGRGQKLLIYNYFLARGH